MLRLHTVVEAIWVDIFLKMKETLRKSRHGFLLHKMLFIPKYHELFTISRVICNRSKQNWWWPSVHYAVEKAILSLGLPWRIKKPLSHEKVTTCYLNPFISPKSWKYKRIMFSLLPNIRKKQLQISLNSAFLNWSDNGLSISTSLRSIQMSSWYESKCQVNV